MHQKQHSLFDSEDIISDPAEEEKPFPKRFLAQLNTSLLRTNISMEDVMKED